MYQLLKNFQIYDDRKGKASASAFCVSSRPRASTDPDDPVDMGRSDEEYAEDVERHIERWIVDFVEGPELYDKLRFEPGQLEPELGRFLDLVTYSLRSPDPSKNRERVSRNFDMLRTPDVLTGSTLYPVQSSPST